LSINIAQR